MQHDLFFEDVWNYKCSKRNLMSNKTKGERNKETQFLCLAHK